MSQTQCPGQGYELWAEPHVGDPVPRLRMKVGVEAWVKEDSQTTHMMESVRFMIYYEI